MTANRIVTRRGLLARLPGVLFLAGARRGWASAGGASQQGRHPTPRKGINASRIVAAKDLHGDATVMRAFELAREIPQIADGIRCHCGCDVMEGYYSLLSCFEKDGMAQHCEVCQRHIVIAHRMHRAGKTLAQIRTAIDAEYR